MQGMDMERQQNVTGQQGVAKHQGAKESDGRKRLFVAFALVVLLGLFTWGSCSSRALPTERTVKWAMSTGNWAVLEKKERTAKEWQPDVTFEGEKGVRYMTVQVWDWGAEDGDVVEINGQQVALKRTPVSVQVDGNYPLEVKGVRDGYGGITVGVRLTGLNQVRVMRIPQGGIGHINVLGK